MKRLNVVDIVGYVIHSFAEIREDHPFLEELAKKYSKFFKEEIKDYSVPDVGEFNGGVVFKSSKEEAYAFVLSYRLNNDYYYHYKFMVIIVDREIDFSDLNFVEVDDYINEISSYVSDDKQGYKIKVGNYIMDFWQSYDEDYDAVDYGIEIENLI